MSVHRAQSSFKAARSPVFSPLYNALMTTSEAAGGSATTDVMTMLRAAGRKAFFPSTNPETGWWQDSNRVTAAALEQPVGWIDDLSGGLALGSELVVNGDGNSVVGWTAGTGVTLSATGGNFRIMRGGSVNQSNYQSFTTVAQKSYQVEWTYRGRSAGSTHYTDFRVGTTAGGSDLYRASDSSGSQFAVGAVRAAFVATTTTTFVSILLRDGVSGDWIELDNISVKEMAGHPATQATSLNRPTYTKKVNVFTSTTDTVSTARTGTTFAGAYTLYIGSGSLTLSGTATGTYTAGSHSITCTAGTLTATPSGTVTNLDCRLTAFAAMNLPAYQSVTSATVYDTVGFPRMLYFDGTSDALATPAIDLSGTDQIMALCNVLKVSDAAQGMVYETTASSAANNGSMFISAPAAASATFSAGSRGTALATATSAASYAAPNLACLRFDADVSSDSVALLRQAASIATSATDQGTGNYSSAALYIGARAGTSLWFKGYMIPGPLLDTTGIPTALLDQMAREQAALWG
jgi:hypothetical protein